jgi:hypothetical protein
VKNRKIASKLLHEIVNQKKLYEKTQIICKTEKRKKANFIMLEYKGTLWPSLTPSWMPQLRNIVGQNEYPSE